jgi:hypothetical protein
MRYMARMLTLGVAHAGSVDYVELYRWALSRVFIMIGFAFIGVGLVFLPLPIPLGLPMIALGVIILLNTSASAKRVFVRWGKKYPMTVGRVRSWMRERHRSARQRREG